MPLWLLFVITLGAVLASIEMGYRWADRRQARSRREVEAPIGAMVASTLGLLAFLLAVTFSIASEAFHDRKVAVVEEANAIRTSYLQTALIPQPQSGSIRALLREYTNQRLLWADVPKIPPARSATVLQSLLWQQTAIVGQKSSDVVALFVESMNHLFDLRAKREMLRFGSRIPAGYIVALLTITLVAHVAMGYHGGVAGTARSPVMVLVGLAFSLVILLIFDLDRPGEGLINVSQRSIIDLRNWMLSAQPFP
jgi:hypothetical protein